MKMKRYLLFAVFGVVAMCASAQDRFYIEDFSITPGETCTVSILLDNATAYTAFQTDIYMPEGLTIEQEDGDYIFELTTRKARDHNIASQPQPNGSIRVMSYSPGVKAYSGNNGALVTFNVTAATAFAGPATILLKNTLFTTTAGVEIAFSDEQCVVTVPATGLMGDVDDDSEISIRDVSYFIDYLLSGDATGINLANADVNGDGEVAINDVSILIDKLLNNN